MTENQSRAEIMSATSITESARTAAKTIIDTAKAVASEITASNVAVGIDISYIKRDVGEIRQSIKELGGYYTTKTETEEIVKNQTDHETRLRMLEQSVWKFIGISSTISALVGMLGSYVLSRISK